MLSESVAQNPTIAVTPGASALTSSLVERGWGGFDRIGPSPPAFHQAHARSASPDAIRNGADQVWSHLIDSVPWTMNHRLISQKIRKQASWPNVMSSTGSRSARGGGAPPTAIV